MVGSTLVPSLAFASTTRMLEVFASKLRRHAVVLRVQVLNEYEYQAVLFDRAHSDCANASKPPADAPTPQLERRRSCQLFLDGLSCSRLFWE
jgi:hypothetical protein